MNALLALRPAPLSDHPHNAREHLRLSLYAVIATVIESCADGDDDAAVQAHPFLADYLDEIRAELDAHDAPARRWREALREWEREAQQHGARLPLLALQRAGLSTLQTELLLAAGLIEEDPRFSQVFEQAQRRASASDYPIAHGGRPSFGLLMAWWRQDDERDRVDEVRRGLQQLIELGLLQLPNPDAPRPDWTPSVSLTIWDALRGELSGARGLRHVPLAQLPQLRDYIAPNEDLHFDALLHALRNDAPVLLIRGPLRNGRKTLAGALARELGKDLLLADDSVLDDEARWLQFGALAALLDAVPAIEAEGAPGESRALPPLPLTDAPLLLITQRQGAWNGVGGRAMLDLELPLPMPARRCAHWAAALPQLPAQALADLAACRRLSSGHLRQVAAGADALARLDGRELPEREDLRRACRALPTARLETLAMRLPPAGALNELIVEDTAREELHSLVARCLWRETLAEEAEDVAGGGVGVRALFAGPSGTGKTLAARLLGAELGRDVYRIDLAAAVNKYLGETEKNLDRALSAAEELDVVLLLDEGDALMANRTDVGSSHDRYANLETNFLLQRIESFQGLLVVTSNAADRIDRAFARRMDVVVNFRAPDPWRRYEILRLHLGDAQCDEDWLQDAASRCALSGGQWRNVVAHARLLALRDGRALATAHLHDALMREYRKVGGSCPLRATGAER